MKNSKFLLLSTLFATCVLNSMKNDDSNGEQPSPVDRELTGSRVGSRTASPVQNAGRAGSMPRAEVHGGTDASPAQEDADRRPGVSPLAHAEGADAGAEAPGQGGAGPVPLVSPVSAPIIHTSGSGVRSDQAAVDGRPLPSASPLSGSGRGAGGAGAVDDGTGSSSGSESEDPRDEGVSGAQAKPVKPDAKPDKKRGSKAPHAPAQKLPSADGKAGPVQVDPNDPVVSGQPRPFCTVRRACGGLIVIGLGAFAIKAIIDWWKKAKEQEAAMQELLKEESEEVKSEETTTSVL